jgi:anaerobic selenocysteine-containing dehydrogenase
MAAKANITRRKFLTTTAQAAAVVAVPAGAMATATEAGPVEKLIAEWQASNTAYCTSDEGITQEMEDAFLAESDAIEQRMLTAKAETPRDAHAFLEWARQEFLEYHGDKYIGDQLIAHALDNALSILRSI